MRQISPQTCETPPSRIGQQFPSCVWRTRARAVQVWQGNNHAIGMRPATVPRYSTSPLYGNKSKIPFFDCLIGGFWVV